AANVKNSRLALITGLSALVVCAAIASGLALTARAQDFASENIKQGEAAYKRGDYKEAVRQYTRAVESEPINLKARLLLADALLTQYVPGANANAASLAAAARQQYLDVLAR